MIRWHMLKNSRILPGTAIEPPMGSDSFVIIENFNGRACYTHIYLIFDILIRYRVIHLIHRDVVIKLYGRSEEHTSELQSR